MALTSFEIKIERLQKELKEAKASRSKAERKECNGQLISFGVLMELIYKNDTQEQRDILKKKATELLLDERNRERAKAGFARLDDALGFTQGEG